VTIAATTDIEGMDVMVMDIRSKLNQRDEHKFSKMSEAKKKQYYEQAKLQAIERRVKHAEKIRQLVFDQRSKELDAKARLL